MIHSITKRDGRVVLYDQNKIAAAILKAMEATGEGNAADAARVANAVHSALEARTPDGSPDIELIQDLVEQQLMNHGSTPLPRLTSCTGPTAPGPGRPTPP